MTTETNDTLEATVRELGFADVRQFARIQAMNLLNSRIREQESIVKTFEQTYQSDWATFQDQFNQVAGSILKKEDDEMAWEAALTYLNLLRQKLERLQTA